MTHIMHSKRANNAHWSLRVELWKRRCIVLAFAFALVTSVNASEVAAEAATHFSIKMNGRLIGYAVVIREKVDQDGRELLRLKSQTSLKVSLLGKERNTKLDSETLIDPRTGRPIRYRITDTTNEVVRHIESEFVDGTARTWIYHDGEARGEPVATRLPDGVVILGSNNFAHWQLLVTTAMNRVAGDTFNLEVFLPDTGHTDSFDFVCGQPQDVIVGGQRRKCVSWDLKKASLNVLADAETGELVRLDLPLQQTTIELAEANIIKLAEKTRAEEVLARHFVQSSVVFDDFLKVSRLKAEIDVTVIGSGIDNELSVLNTAMQRFEGNKNGSRIVGEITVHTVPFRDDRASPAFPTSAHNRDMDVWLRPSVHIESEHPALMAKAAELTKGAETRWDAVLKIGRWIYQEIAYVIADTPSARRAFETRKGDCGPHSTLMVAMLRASGIPARLVGGLVYTPAFGGSFGQHAWVEVHLGEAGWLAIDPTTGEFDQLSATHIKLFEGLGSVLPESVKVTEFEPPNRVATGAAFAAAKPLPWKLGKKYTFKYNQGDQELGTETFTITEIDQDGKVAYELKAEVQLKINLIASLKTNTTLITAPNAQPISFNQDLSALLQNVKIACSFNDGIVQEEISGTTNLSREIKLPPGAYCFDNNLMGAWVLLCSQLTFAADTSVHIHTFHPSTLQIIPVTFTAKAPAAIEIGGKKVVCFECDVLPIKNTFWVSRDGRFLRARQGDLVIELAKVD